MYKVFYTLGYDNLRHMVFFSTYEAAYEYVCDMIESTDCTDIVIKNANDEVVYRSI